MRHAAQLVECFRTAFNYHVIHGSSILHADIMGMLKAAPVGAADAVFKQNALGYRHTGFVVRRVFGRAAGHGSGDAAAFGSASAPVMDSPIFAFATPIY